MIAVILQAYPNFIKQIDGEPVDITTRTMVELWSQIFKDIDSDAAIRASIDHIKEQHFPPVIADIYQRALWYMEKQTYFVRDEMYMTEGGYDDMRSVYHTERRLDGILAAENRKRIERK